MKEKEKETFSFRTMEWTQFFLILWLNTTRNNPGHYIKNICKETWEDGEKKTDQSGTLGPKELHGGEVPGFYFCLRCPKLAVKEVCDPETPTGPAQKSPAKDCSFSMKDQGRAISRKNITLLQTNTTETQTPPLQSPNGKPSDPSLLDSNEASQPSLPNPRQNREARVGLETFIPLRAFHTHHNIVPVQRLQQGAWIAIVAQQ